MKKYNYFTLALLLLCSTAIKAQVKDRVVRDTLIISKKGNGTEKNRIINDTIYLKNYYPLQDSFRYTRRQLDSMHIVFDKSDSAYVRFNTHDSTFRFARSKQLATAKKYHSVADSLFVIDSARGFKLFRATSAKTPASVKTLSGRLKHPDSMHLNRLDSLHYSTAYSATYKSYPGDSAYVKFKKMDSLHVRYDSLKIRYKLARVDSVKLDTRLKKINGDFQRLKVERIRKRIDSLERVRRPIIIVKKVACDSNATIVVADIGYPVIVKTAPSNSVKMSGEVSVFDEDKKGDNQYFNRLGLSMIRSEKTVRISADFKNVAELTLAEDVPVVKNAFTITIPENAKLEMESNAAEVIIEDNISDLAIKIEHADLHMKNAGKAAITCNYGKVTAGTIQDATVNVNDCLFVCASVEKFNINSKYSKVIFDRSNSLTFNSVGDQYDIKQVTTLTGSKTFGKMSVSNVKKVFVLTGSNADVKINEIDPAAELVRISNKYADLKVPLINRSNYTMDFTGKTAASPDKFAEFSKLPKFETNASGFTVAAGNVKQDHTKVEINCNSCVFDFN